jgi:hypothetical protein
MWGNDPDYLEGAYEAYLDKMEKFQKNVNRNAKKGLWVTKDGEKLRFENLTEKHKKRIIALCKYNNIKLPDSFFGRVKQCKLCKEVKNLFLEFLGFETCRLYDEQNNYLGYSDSFAVLCKKCNHKVTGKNQEDAIERWNWNNKQSLQHEI